MKKITLLASDTPHRRFFINQLILQGVEFDQIIFETESIKPSFPAGADWEKEEKEFEQQEYFKELSSEVQSNEIHYVSTVNSRESQELLESNPSDLVVVFGTRKVAKRIMNVFADGGINVHRGIAEEYRGLDSNLWAVYHKDFDNVGVTIHAIDDDLDTGEILFQEKLRYPSDVKVFQMRYFETVLCIDLALRALRQYFDEKINKRKQVKKGRYYSFMPQTIKELLPQRLESYESFRTHT